MPSGWTFCRRPAPTADAHWKSEPSSGLERDSGGAFVDTQLRLAPEALAKVALVLYCRA